MAKSKFVRKKSSKLSKKQTKPRNVNKERTIITVIIKIIKRPIIIIMKIIREVRRKVKEKSNVNE